MITTMQIIFDFLADGGNHLLLSAGIGLFIYLFSSSLLYAPYSMVCKMVRKDTNIFIVYGIFALCIVFALFIGIMCHSALDYFSRLYVMPLAPPLEIIR